MQFQETSAAGNQAENSTGDFLAELCKGGMSATGTGQAEVDPKAIESTGTNTSETHSSNAVSSAAAEPGDLGSVAMKATKAAVKSFTSIQGFEQNAESQRSKVRELMAKQAACLEAKLSGEGPVEGEDFETVAKQLRKENNKLDAMLECKEGMFGKVRQAIENAVSELTAMVTALNQLEEEG